MGSTASTVLIYSEQLLEKSYKLPYEAHKSALVAVAGAIFCSELCTAVVTISVAVAVSVTCFVNYIVFRITASRALVVFFAGLSTGGRIAYCPAAHFM